MNEHGIISFYLRVGFQFFALDIMIHQKLYVHQILLNTDMIDCKLTLTLLLEGFFLSTMTKMLNIN